MPKETVHHGTKYAEIPNGNGITIEVIPLDGLSSPMPPGTVITEDPSLEVAWTRDMAHVQVAIDMPRELWIQIAQDLSTDDRVSRKAIYTGVLTRQEINHTIRTLRRARDAAYGSDE